LNDGDRVRVTVRINTNDEVQLVCKHPERPPAQVGGQLRRRSGSEAAGGPPTHSKCTKTDLAANRTFHRGDRVKASLRPLAGTFSFSRGASLAPFRADTCGRAAARSVPTLCGGRG